MYFAEKTEKNNWAIFFEADWIGKTLIQDNLSSKQANNRSQLLNLAYKQDFFATGEDKFKHFN